jgi:signal transduction histidine kinase
METIIPANIRRLFQKQGAQMVLEAGDVLFRQGEASDAVYQVLSGTLAVYAGDGGDNSVLLNCVGAGHMVGELGAITHQPRSATLVATSRTVLSRIPTPQFRALLTDTLSLVETMVSATRVHLLSADAARIRLGNTCEQSRMRMSKLGQEKEQLEALLRLRDELESMVVHDLRNPLNTVVMALELLENQRSQVGDPEQFLLLIRMAKTASRGMEELISSLLEIARLEAGKLTLDIQSFDLCALLAEVTAAQRLQATYKAVETVIESPIGLMVKTDRGLLWRIVMNLLDNAIKFAPEKSRIGIEASAQDDGSVRISVTDAGPGIPLADRERIFEKFAQAGDGEHAKQTGTGLGLTFCRMALEALGGAIGVDAGPAGKGSCFSIRIPGGG